MADRLWTICWVLNQSAVSHIIGIFAEKLEPSTKQAIVKTGMFWIIWGRQNRSCLCKENKTSAMTQNCNKEIPSDSLPRWTCFAAPYFITPFNHSNSNSNSILALSRLATLPPAGASLKAANKSSTLVVNSEASNNGNNGYNKTQQGLRMTETWGLVFKASLQIPFWPLWYSRTLQFWRSFNIQISRTNAPFPTVQYSKCAADEGPKRKWLSNHPQER